MTEIPRFVTGGVDSHAESHDAAALDERGRLLGGGSFPATALGYRELLAWLESFGPVRLVGVESSGSYAAGLVRYLSARGVRVVEVNRPHAHTRRRRGKSDAIDAEAAARKALAGEARAIPKQTGGIVESIRQLRVARESAVKARTAALNQLKDLVVTAPAELREQLAGAKTGAGRVRLCLRLRPDQTRLEEPLQAAKLALRSIAKRIRALEAELAELDRQLERLVATAAPRTLGLRGVSTQNGGQLLVSAGQNIERLPSEAAFAHLCGASPIPASSGQTRRHRLNYGGDRQANRALHMVAVCRLRSCARTRAYAERRTAEGLSKKEVLRCLKRSIAREVYRALRADLAALAESAAASTQQARRTVAISCGAGPLGITRTRSPGMIAGSQSPHLPETTSGRGRRSHRRRRKAPSAKRLERRETGMEKEMRELYVEGVAIHDGPESCVGVREGVGEALTGVRVGWAMEPRNALIRGADVIKRGGRPCQRRRYRESPVDPARSENPGTHGISMHGNREIPRSPVGVGDAPSLIVRGVAGRRSAGRGGNATAVSPR
jgi:transposase